MAILISYSSAINDSHLYCKYLIKKCIFLYVYKWKAIKIIPLCKVIKCVYQI